MCFYLKVIERKAPFDTLSDDQHHVAAQAAAAVYNATTGVSDAVYDEGFTLLRELGVKYGGREVVPFIDAYLQYRADAARRFNILISADGDKTAQAISAEMEKPVYNDRAEVSVDETARLDSIERGLTAMATDLVRIKPDDLKKLRARARSPKAADILMVLHNARVLIRCAFDSLT